MNTISLISFLIVAVVIALANAIPTPQKIASGDSFLLVQEPEDPYQNDGDDFNFAVEEERGNRFRRATCDLLSISLPWGSLNHSACAAHCIAMRKGFKGGRCKDGVCHCRR